MSKKILVITYYWPPYGGVGAFRITKFVKYLVKAGWEITILAPDHAEVPIFDKSILKDVPSGIKLYRTKIFEPFNLYRKFTGQKPKEAVSTTIFLEDNKSWKTKISRWIRLNIFIPDAKIGWYPFAVTKGKEIIKNEKPNLIFSTSPPPTTHLIAGRLAKWSKLKWVADFRDPWTKISYYDTSGINYFSKKFNAYLEKKVLNQSNKLTLVNDGFFPGFANSQKTTIIPNGFDTDDLKSLQTRQPNNKFTIRYLGSFKLNQNIEGLFGLFQSISEDNLMCKKIKIEFYGFTEPLIQRKIQAKNYNLEINFYNYVDRQTALNLIYAADMTLLIIGRSKLNKSIISAKIFDYVMAEKPVLAFGPLDGDANKILQKSNCGVMFAYDDLIEPHLYLRSIFINRKNGKADITINKNEIKKYDFKYLTRLLDQQFMNLLK